MLKSLLIVGAGSFVGGVLRYCVSMLMKPVCGQGFPWGTLLVNLSGCFVFGLMFALLGKWNAQNGPWLLFLTTGLCGGFTTFSAFAHESVQMLQNEEFLAFFCYVFASAALGFLLMGLGYFVAK